MKDFTRPRLRELITFKNPVVLASGPLGLKAESMKRFGSVAGGIVAKSVTWLPQKGNPTPRVTRVRERGMINWEDFPNPGYQAFQNEIKAAREASECPIIGSISPIEIVEQYQAIAAAFQDAGVDAIELDFKWEGRAKGGLLSKIIKAVKDTVSVPVSVKLSPFVGNIADTAKVAEDAGADAITAINTVFPAMRINCRLKRPAIVTGFGGLSGEPILPLAVAMVYQIFRAVDIPIMGVGGVMTGGDALEMIMAGAEVVQVCTAAMLGGPAVFERINNELESSIGEFGLGSIEECVGLAHEYPLYLPHSSTTAEK